MKLIFFTLLLSSLAHAHGPHRRLASAINILQDPSAGTNNLCAETEPEPGAWCEDLAASVCADAPTTAVNYGSMAEALVKTHVASLPPSASALDVVRAQMNAIAAAERETAERTKISADDLSNLTSEVRASLIRQINGSPIAAANKTQMTDRISTLSFKSAAEVVNIEKQRILRENPDFTEADAETDAVIFYTDTCGSEGMELNAFYDSGSNAFVICPGLLQSFSDLGKNKEAAMRGLEFTLIHEVGHSIDGIEYLPGTPVTDQAVYENMKTCHEAENPEMSWENQRGEIIADFWAVKVLSERYGNRKILGEEVRDNIALAMNGLDLCNVDGDKAHPAGTFRMNNIFGRDPQIRAQLECEAPTPEKPYCGINGAQPPRPTPAP